MPVIHTSHFNLHTYTRHPSTSTGADVPSDSGRCECACVGLLSVQLNDHLSSSHDFSFHRSLLLTPEAIDYSKIEAAIEAAGQ